MATSTGPLDYESAGSLGPLDRPDKDEARNLSQTGRRP